MSSTFFKGVALGATVSVLVLAATTAIAGTGVGGIFNLGVSNTVNASTRLSGGNPAAGLDVANSGTGSAIAGRRTQTAPTATAGPAIRGENLSTNANGVGILGTHSGAGTAIAGRSKSGVGVQGNRTAATGSGTGVRGIVASPDAYGGRFENLTAGSGTAGVGLLALGRGQTEADVGIGGDGFDGAIEAAGPNGVEGNSTTPGGYGVTGDAPAIGVVGSATAAGGIGVRGNGGATGVGVSAFGGTTGLDATGTTNGITVSGGSFGVDANVTAAGAVGIHSSAGSSSNDAVQADTSSTTGDALQGITTGSNAFGLFAITSGGAPGVVSSSGSGTSVAGSNNSSTNATYTGFNAATGGTAGTFTGTNALRVRPNAVAFSTGLTADMTGDVNGDGNVNNDGANAIIASSDDTNNAAVITANSLPSPTCDAFTCEAIETSGFVDVNGNARVTGTLTKGAGSFEIDHPLDPANYYLRHSFVESPDMKNVYDGIATTDASGRATVRMPDYFAALNKDPRYQLTVMGATFAQAIISKELAPGGRTFEIRTNKPNTKVSWQVTGIRQDAYANAHRIKVVEKKTGAAAGMYLHPELFGHAGMRPLGLDLPASPVAQMGASAKAESELYDLIAMKTNKALKQARLTVSSRPAPPRPITQG